MMSCSSCGTCQQRMSDPCSSRRRRQKRTEAMVGMLLGTGEMKLRACRASTYGRLVLVDRRHLQPWHSRVHSIEESGSAGHGEERESGAEQRLSVVWTQMAVQKLVKCIHLPARSLARQSCRCSS